MSFRMVEEQPPQREGFQQRYKAEEGRQKVRASLQRAGLQTADIIVDMKDLLRAKLWRRDGIEETLVL